MIVFTHIPRTGGTSVRSFIADHVKRSKFADALTDFAFLSDEELNGYDFVASHCGFGFFGRISRDNFKMILLRDPVERIVSQYYHLKNLSENVSYASHYAKTMTLDEFVVEPNPAVSVFVENTQTWHLIEDKNLAFRNRHSGLTDKEKLELAFEHLSGYDLIGFTERLGAVFDRLCEANGWRSGTIPHLRKSTKPELSELSASTLESIRSRVALDVALYRLAVERWGA
jgi:hypothetical protein